MATRTIVGPVTTDIETGQMPRMHEDTTNQGMDLDNPAQMGLGRSSRLHMDADVVERDTRLSRDGFGT
jgi:hypothetical protein